ncbi:MAG: DSD1 family PLP-dependent enzyme [Phycisphaeraceae bacterium]|nr:DSD1 family PLP-dependent enzyme [Phycisphaeraceae bacterium]
MDTPRNLIGQSLDDLDTPCLTLNLTACDKNLRTMSDAFAGKACKLRPHFKNHKCVTLARKQLAAGNCVGITCAKLGEAEVLAQAGGFDDLLIANQVVGPAKMARLVEAARKTRLTVAVDHPCHVDEIDAAATTAGVVIDLLVEVDIGMGRCGVQPGEPALDLARRIVGRRGVRFRGLQAYEGHAVYTDDPAMRRDNVTRSMNLAIQTRRLIEQTGIPVEVVSGGSSSTYPTTGSLDGVNEIQSGTYATMDWRYQQLAPRFDLALTVLTTVISTPAAGRAVLDVGVKGIGAEFGNPRVLHEPEAEIPSFRSEEHTVVRNVPAWRIGRKVHLVPSHACTTCNLYRQFIVHQDGRVVDVWPIEGSGRLA